MKYSTFAEYDPRGLALAEPALLTVWSGIGSYHDELVLVGGLVPQYLCRHPVSATALPRPGTLGCRSRHRARCDGRTIRLAVGGFESAGLSAE
jgi:hypothetical protein